MKILCGLMVLPALFLRFAVEAQEKPNIVMIVADDLGWADVGYHGSKIKTPHIDKLAKTGVVLTQHYATPTCTPTRVSLMTGKYASRYGVIAPDYGEVIDLGDPTLASALSENGYFTAILGKWHLGSPPYTPLKYGFQSSYGYFAGQIDPYTHEYKTEIEQARRQTWHRNDEYLIEEGHATDLITDEAVRLIETQRARPFFLYVAYSVPHYPLDEPEEWTSIYDSLMMFPSRKQYAAAVSHMDHGVGRIVEALDRMGLRENTLILFMSDNGGQESWQSETEYRGKYADKPHKVLGNNYPLRGWKGDLYEGGVRVPALINWPEKLTARSFDYPIHATDWFPALAGLTGSKIPSGLDGMNIWSYLAGGKVPDEDRAMYWKTGAVSAVRKGNWKLLLHSNGDVELYDLANDFRETRDLSKTNPEQVRRLIGLLEEMAKNDRE